MVKTVQNTPAYAKLALSNVTYAPIWQENDEHSFSLSTGHPEDYACFAIWSGAKEKESEIVEGLKDSFELIGDFGVHWSKKHYNRNIARLYEKIGRLEDFAGWDEKVGPTPFRFLIVRDRSPQYTWKQSVSGLIEPSNERVVDAKYRYRALFEKKYQVHSSNNVTEFLVQSALILGHQKLQTVLGTAQCLRETIYKDLEGAEGWDDWRHLLAVLNLSTKYLILRNSDGLPDHLEDSDIDFLCDNFQRLASAANVRQLLDRPYKGTMNVGDSEISVDIRFIGDGYYPACWQMDMLERRVMKDGFYAPAPDDLFFSLLYHCKVQKPSVKPKYHTELAAIARDLGFDWFKPYCLYDDEESAKILAGYMKARGFYYENPVDKGVYCNQPIVASLRQLAARPGMGNKMQRSIRAKIWKGIRRPRKVVPYLLRRFRPTNAK